MKRDQFLSRLNARAGTRYGCQIERSTLESWVKEDFFEGVRRGTHEWTCASYRGALQVCRLRSRGISKANETRLHLWLQGAEIPLDRLRQSAEGELESLRATIRRQSSSSFDPRSGEPPKGQTARGFEIAASHASSDILPPGFSWSGMGLMNFAGLLRFNSPPQASVESVAPLLENVGLDSGPIRAEINSAIPGLFSGFFAEPQEIENSFQTKIERATIEDFRMARRQFRFAKIAFKLVPIWARADAVPAEMRDATKKLEMPAATTSQAMSGNWACTLFLLFLNFQLQIRLQAI